MQINGYNLSQIGKVPMTAGSESQSNSSTDVNSRKSLFSTIYLGIVGPALFLVQPGFVQGLVEYLGFSEQQAGYVASAEMWGIAITTLLLTVVAHKVNWRYLLIAAVLLATAGNFLSMMTTDITLFSLLRFITGVGSGVLISLTFTIIGLTANPDRNFGYFIMWMLLYGGIGFLIMPLGYESVGMVGILAFFGLFNLSALPFIRYLPASGPAQTAVDKKNLAMPSGYKMLAVSTLLIYFMAQGVVWAYLFLMGTGAGVTEQSVTNSLTLSQFFGVAGALTAAIIADRFGRASPLALGVAGSVFALLLLLGDTTALIYGVSVCLYNYAWNKTHPFLMAALADFDPTGRLVSLGVAAQMLGLAIGPALAAFVLGESGYANIIWLGIGLFITSFIAILPPILKQGSLRKLSK